MKRLLHLHAGAEDVGREPRKMDELSLHRDRIGHRFGDDFEIRDDPRLAGMDHVAARIVAAKHLALDQADAAGAANAGPAIMRQLDAVHHRAVEQEVADIGDEALLVDGHLASLLHDSCFRIISFHFKPDRPDMPCMPDLAVIEGCDPHEGATLQRNVVSAVGVELARHFERPVPAGPARRAAHVGAVAGEFAEMMTPGSTVPFGIRRSSSVA